MNNSKKINKDKVLDKIKDIAVQLDGSSLTRADLAFELKKYGISKDSIAVSKLIWESYCKYKNLPAIQNAFVNNDSNCSVVNDYKMRVQMNNGETEQYFASLEDDLNTGNSALASLSTLLGDGNSASAHATVSRLLSTVSGTSGIQKIRENASNIVEAYSNLVNGYEDSKVAVKEISNDFVDLRGDILRIYEKYVLTLTDFFGDSIKHVAPELFDFDAIEYLDTQNMLQTLKLKYDELTENCSVLINEISDSFVNSIKSALQASRGTGRGTGLAIASVYAISHFLNASEKENRMKMELDSLKMNIKHDATAIKADYARLLTIFKTLNDLYIPKAHVYFKYSDKLLSREFSAMLASLYEKAGVKELIVKRDTIQSEIRQLTDEINDHQYNIDYYEQNISRCQSMLDAKNDDYQNAIAKCPSKPFFLVNWITFGQAKKSYNRNMYEWNAVSGKVVREYKNFHCDIQLDTNELSQHKEEKEVLVAEREKLKINNKEVTKQIMQTIQVDDNMKKQLAVHLEDIIQMLHIGREVLQSKLSPKQMKTVDIVDYRNNELPQEVKQSINTFTSAFGEIIPDVASDISQEITDSIDAENQMKSKSDAKQEDNAASQGLTENKETPLAVTQALRQGLNHMQTWLELDAKRVQNEISTAQYDKQLTELQKSFKYDMQDVDDKSAVLREILKHINTASNNEQQKQAFLELANSTKVFESQAQLDDFLNGKKTIEI